jgi:hypothetical protein
LDGFPENIRHFIADHIGSVSELETLLLLRHRSDQAWTAAAVAREMYVPVETAATHLSRFASVGLLTLSAGPDGPAYSYAPRSAELDKLTGALADLYRERRVAVISLIYSGPIEKVRSFADAFRLRRRED